MKKEIKWWYTEKFLKINLFTNLGRERMNELIDY